MRSPTCTAEVDTTRTDPDTALCLYRIAQEALRNVAKHADAHHVGVTLTTTTDGVQLSIVDDGKGFDLTGARGTRAGLGLVSIDERARLPGGSVRIDTKAREGTRLDVQIPFTPSGALTLFAPSGGPPVRVEVAGSEFLTARPTAGR
jgi:signal transduction histidine kinase